MRCKSSCGFPCPFLFSPFWHQFTPISLSHLGLWFSPPQGDCTGSFFLELLPFCRLASPRCQLGHYPRQGFSEPREHGWVRPPPPTLHGRHHGCPCRALCGRSVGYLNNPVLLLARCVCRSHSVLGEPVPAQEVRAWGAPSTLRGPARFLQPDAGLWDGTWRAWSSAVVPAVSPALNSQRGRHTSLPIQHQALCLDGP